ncbi:MAG: hypothetical protein EP302_00065, partial [Bacteroidetes bacterium]
MINPGCRKDRLSGTLVLVLSLLSILFPLSCEKSEGLGGTGSIEGTITEQFFNDDYSLLIHEQAAVDEDVFIVFGNREELGARVRTNDRGQFRFKYLYPGNYRVYFISEDSASVLDLDREKVVEVELERDQEMDLGNLEKLTTLDFDEGSARIRGVVKVIDYVDLSTWPDLVIEKTY